MKKLVEQSPLDIEATAKAVSEQIDRSLMNGAGYPVIDGGPRQRSVCRVPDPNRGLVRKLADSLLHFIGYRRRGEAFIDRQRD